jgi:hypothetical protein
MVFLRNTSYPVGKTYSLDKLAMSSNRFRFNHATHTQSSNNLLFEKMKPDFWNPGPNPWSYTYQVHSLPFLSQKTRCGEWQRKI